MTSTAMAAARLLREYAEELKRSHTIFSSGAWPEGESEAKAAYEQHIVIASALEAMPAQCLYQIQEPTGNHSEIPSSSVMPNNCSVAAPAAVAVPDEREAFEAKFKHLDLSRDRDAWMQEKYKHAAISLAWEAWQGRAALAATPADHIADAGKMVENVREGAPYDNPAFEHLARDLGVWGTAQSAICAQFWLAATPAAAPVDKSPEFQGSMVDKNMNLQGLEAAPVVLPEPDAAIIDIMRMVASFGEASRKNKAIELREAELFHAIETKLRALLATGGQAQAHAVEQEPFGYFKAEPFGWTDCGPDDEGAVALYERPQAQADARDAGEFWGVLSPCGEGVFFRVEADARWTHTGHGSGSDGFGVPTIGEAFRESYEDDELELVRVHIAAQAAQQGGAA